MTEKARQFGEVRAVIFEGFGEGKDRSNEVGGRMKFGGAGLNVKKRTREESKEKGSGVFDMSGISDSINRKFGVFVFVMFLFFPFTIVNLSL